MVDKWSGWCIHHSPKIGVNSTCWFPKKGFMDGRSIDARVKKVTLICSRKGKNDVFLNKTY